MKYGFKRHQIKIFCALLICSGEKALANYEGRFSVGAYSSTENISDPTIGVTRNDYLMLLSRYYLRVSDLGSDKWELVSDVRDNNDFYDKLDAADLQLTERNKFQVPQLFARWANPEGRWSSYLGRFSFSEAGDVYVDGVAIEYRWTKHLYSAVFSGLNPKTPYQATVGFNSNATLMGT